jgi:hypothetical protein
MRNIILLSSYFGLSDFVSNWTCSGRCLPLEEILSTKITTKEDLERHKNSDYSLCWYEIEPSSTLGYDFRDDKEDYKIVFTQIYEEFPFPVAQNFELDAYSDKKIIEILSSFYQTRKTNHIDDESDR